MFEFSFVCCVCIYMCVCVCVCECVLVLNCYVDFRFWRSYIEGHGDLRMAWGASLYLPHGN